jgi:hypothetical protein
MKKVFFYIIPIIMVIMACASSGTPATVTDGGSPGMDLDAAIREVAVQMESKIPSKTMVALVSVASPSTAFSTQVLTRLESTIVSSGKLVVVDRANLDKVREEQGFQLSGEVDDESAKSIGKLLGAGAIVTGSLADLGDVYSLTLKAINIETATVAVSYLADLAKSARVETLLASGGGAAGIGTRTAQAGGSAVPASQATPQAPVYDKEYKTGDEGPAGGLIFYDKGNSSGGWRYLEAAPKSTEFITKWGAYGKIVRTATDIGAGKRNTALIVAVLNTEGETGAAQYCDDLEVNGFDDWFLPSKGELGMMYRNLMLKGLGGFSSTLWSCLYWSSSEEGSNKAWYQNFSDGNQASGPYAHFNKEDSQFSVRAIRQF